MDFFPTKSLRLIIPTLIELIFCYYLSVRLTNSLILIMLITFSSCLLKDESPISSSSNDVNLIQSDDIIISNLGNDTIVLLDSDGSYKDVLVDSQTTSTLIYNGLAYDHIDDRILFAYDSTTTGQDAIMAISLFDGEVSTVLSNGQLNGTLPGVARLTTGDFVMLEGTSAVEKFTSTGTRVGTPFLTGMTTTLADITRLSGGGFILCSSGTSNTVRIYNATGTLQSSATSANPVPTLGALASTSCTQDPSGRIVVAYSGGTDAVRVYNSSLSTVIWTFTDTNVLTTPGKLAVRSNGNILITDTGFDHIVELSPEGSLVRVIGGAVLSDPSNIVVVP